MNLVKMHVYLLVFYTLIDWRVLYHGIFTGARSGASENDRRYCRMHNVIILSQFTCCFILLIAFMIFANIRPSVVLHNRCEGDVIHRYSSFIVALIISLC